MTQDEFDVIGLFLKDQLESKDPIYHVIERDDGYIDVSGTDFYFKSAEYWSTQEREVLEYAMSPILDIGCGAGRHSLYLQNKGLDVTAFDISEGALDVVQKRGITKIIKGSVHNLPTFDKPFSTFLLFFNMFGLGGSPTGSMMMLKALHQHSTPDAKIILSYGSPIPTENPSHLAYHKRNQDAGLPIGQVKIRMRYLHHKSDWFSLYLPTPEEFRNITQNAGWKITVDLIDTPFHYVVLERGI